MGNGLALYEVLLNKCRDQEIEGKVTYHSCPFALRTRGVGRITLFLYSFQGHRRMNIDGLRKSYGCCEGLTEAAKGLPVNSS